VEWDAKARRGEERDANGQRRKRGEGMEIRKENGICARVCGGGSGVLFRIAAGG